jgi:hypothetical protein
MKKVSLKISFLPVLIFLLVACAPAPSATPTARPTGAPPSPTGTPTAAPANPGLIAPPPLSFEAATYKDEANNFELDYPAGWTLIPKAQTGSRGSSAQVFSTEHLPTRGTRVSINVYQWDPKHDLAAYADHRRSAWEGSGSTVSSLPGGTLADGRERVSFIVQGPDKLKTFVQLTTLGDAYLEIAGEGDPALIQEIANTVRPLNFRP